jgi:integrase/recombinase XerD
VDFKNWLINNGKSKNTIDSYSLHVTGFQKWFKNSFGREQNILYRENILDYISYLLNIKHLNGKSVNAKLSALLKFNEYLITKNVQSDYVMTILKFKLST